MYFIYSLRPLVILFTSKQYSTQICSHGFCWFLFCKQVQCKIMKYSLCYLYKNTNHIHFTLPTCMYVIPLFAVDLITMNICSSTNILKRKLEHEHTKISYINKLFEFKIHTNLNSLDKTLRFLVRFWMDGRAAKLIFANIV